MLDMQEISLASVGLFTYLNIWCVGIWVVNVELTSFETSLAHYSLCTKALIYAIIVQYLYLRENKAKQSMVEENPLPRMQVTFKNVLSTNVS